jgi:hypothetical protein
MTVEIQLTQGQKAIVDAEDFPKVANIKWNAAKNGKRGQFYAMNQVSAGKGVTIATPMHRLIMDAPKGMVVDHINGDTLDNRRSNLRICTIAQNGQNRSKQSNNTSGVKGVYCNTTRGTWQVAFDSNGKRHYGGTFHSLDSARNKAISMITELHGDFATL